jgi:hypothetical protein
VIVSYTITADVARSPTRRVVDGFMDVRTAEPAHRPDTELGPDGRQQPQPVSPRRIVVVEYRHPVTRPSRMARPSTSGIGAGVGWTDRVLAAPEPAEHRLARRECR